MLSGTIKTFNKLNAIIITFFILLSVFSCKDKNRQQSYNTLFPESGTMLKLGEDLNFSLIISGGLPDSIQYFVDDKLVASKADTASFSLSTLGMTLGKKQLVVKMFRGDKTEELKSQIVITSSIKPVLYSFEIEDTFNHDITSYTQGLEYHGGVFYESDGEYGASSLRKVALDGKVLQQKDLEARYFAEGITVVGDKILQLTYKEKVMFVYDKNTFELLQTIPYNHAEEGWGLTYDGETIYNTDGTNRIFKLNKETFQPEGIIEVYDDKGAVVYLNEMEWVDGKIYANIYTSDMIAIINPQTGEVEGYINLIGLHKDAVGDTSQDVLNGIAWDGNGKRLFVTGKKWNKLYQIKLVKQ